MIANRLIQLCTFLRRPNISTQRIFAYHVTNVEKIKDNMNSLEYENNDPEKLLAQLNSRNLSKILIDLEVNKNIIKGPHIITALKSLIKFKNETFVTIDSDSLRNKHPLYNEITVLIESKINELTSWEMIEILKNLIRLKVPAKSCVVENILKQIKGNLNNMKLEDFGTLSKVIKKMTQTPLVRNMQKQLKKYFFLRLSCDFDVNNITSLQSALSFLSSNCENYNLLESVIKNLRNYENEIPLHTSIEILVSLCNLNYFPEGWLDVLHKIEDVILNNIDELKMTQVNYIIFLLTEKYKQSRIKQFYNPDLLDKFAQKLIKDDAGFDLALNALKCFIFMRHESTDLLNYVFATYFERNVFSGKKVDDNFGKFLVLITSAAMSMHKSIFWKEIEEYILTNNDVLKNHHETLTILALNLLCLETYHIPLLHKIYNENYDYTGQSFLHWTFCKIYQKLEADKIHNRPTLSESQKNAMTILCHKAVWIQNARENKINLLRHIEDGLGGSIYVKSCVATKFFHMIDHVVVFQKDGFPVPINPEANTKNRGILNYIEDLNVPPESQILLIIYFQANWYFNNTQNMLGNYRLFVNTLEAMSYKVVPIIQDVWDELPENKRTFFVMNEIQSKLFSN